VDMQVDAGAKMALEDAKDELRNDFGRDPK
jgi:hypothetical protein